MAFLFGVALQLCFIASLDAANVLFLFFPSFSHLRGSLNVANELASHGHVVWNAVTTELANDKRLRIPGVKNLEYKSLDNYDIEEMFMNKMVEEYFEHGNVRPIFEDIKKVCDLILRDKSLFQKAKKMNFDLIILDSVPIARTLTVFAYKLNVPFMFIGAAFEPYVSRTPFVLSAFPYLICSWSPEMNFRTRVLNSIIMSANWIYNPFAYDNAVELYAPERPYITLEALSAKGLLWLIELEPLLHYPQALLPNVKIIGSLSAGESKALPENYKKFMDDAKHGVVIVSFGSNVKKVPKEISQRFFDAFARTKYKYIFKTDKKETLGSNVMLTDWMPQADLLAHSNTKLFITHCGANGQNEAFLNGVPMIGFPMFAEQHFNAEKIVYKGFGLRMDLKTFTVDELVASINEVIQNSSYSKKIKKTAEITKLRKRSPNDEAVYWIEHVLQYGGDHLRSYCQDMPLYQYLNLDVIGLLLFLIHLTIYLIWKCTCVCCRKICKRSSDQKTKRE